MSKKKIQIALEDPITQAKKSEGLLGKLFWGVISQYNFTYARWNHTFDKYVRDPLNVPEQTTNRRNECRNNLVSALTGRNPSWLQFLRGLKAVDVRRIRVTIDVWQGPNLIQRTVSTESILAELPTEDSSLPADMDDQRLNDQDEGGE